MRLGFVIAPGVASWLAAGALIGTGALPQEGVERFTDGAAAHGAALYKRYCRGCHGEDGRGGAHTFMPHIQNLTKKDYIEFIPDGFLSEGRYG
jgi:mono/diheme cytochrome c family protein